MAQAPCLGAQRLDQRRATTVRCATSIAHGTCVVLVLGSPDHDTTSPVAACILTNFPSAQPASCMARVAVRPCVVFWYLAWFRFEGRVSSAPKCGKCADVDNAHANAERSVGPRWLSAPWARDAATQPLGKGQHTESNSKGCSHNAGGRTGEKVAVIRSRRPAQGKHAAADPAQQSADARW